MSFPTRQRLGRGANYPRRFGPRFILLKQLNTGPMGHVFLALTGQPGVDRLCALKVLKEGRAGRDTEEMTQRFLSEAKVVTKLSHENLVYIFDFGIHVRQGYLAMEYVQGKSITETWNRCAILRDGFPIGLSIYYIAELVSALWYAAQMDRQCLLHHRVISPSKIILTYTGGVKLVDLGLTKWKIPAARSEKTTVIPWSGEWGYASPEKYIGKPVDHRSDLFSAGIILWELLTGRQMFLPSETRLPNTSVPPPSRYTHDVTPALDRVVSKALSNHPANRFQTGEEMCAELMAAMPNEWGGKMQAAKFIQRLFKVEMQDELAEQRELIERAGRMDDPLQDEMPDGAAHLDSPAQESTTDPLFINQQPNVGKDTPNPTAGNLLGKSHRRLVFPPWARAWGEDEFGLWAEFEYKGVAQRMRRIAPGRFWMGSTKKSEPMRDRNELLHEVELSEEYWLADTACTQELWIAVMDENPSRFTERQVDENSRPVEQVSWDDCKDFLWNLSEAIPGLDVRLPTEAEWEYACRAGTRTPFSFGGNITSAQVNYDGTYPYPGGGSGEYREKTVPVKSLPANPWGLFEMHGNVDEWCHDEYGAYHPGPAVNPLGTGDGTSLRQRVARGGSWNYRADFARSARRSFYEPEVRFSLVGFRIAQGRPVQQVKPACREEK